MGCRLTESFSVPGPAHDLQFSGQLSARRQHQVHAGRVASLQAQIHGQAVENGFAKRVQCVQPICARLQVGQPEMAVGAGAGGVNGVNVPRIVCLPE